MHVFGVRIKRCTHPPTDQPTYYEMVTCAEVLKGATVDHTDLRRGCITLLPRHTEQMQRVHARAMAAVDGDYLDSVVASTLGSSTDRD